jgi:hypothetical protein
MVTNLKNQHASPTDWHLCNQTNRVSRSNLQPS